MPRFTREDSAGKVLAVWLDGKRVEGRAIACDTDEGWADLYPEDKKDWHFGMEYKRHYGRVQVVMRDGTVYEGPNPPKENNQPDPEFIDGWISVEDRLPENDSLVLIASRLTNSAGDSRYYILTNFFLVQETRWANDALIDNITHWRPLPAPPKMEDDEKRCQK